MSLSHNSDKLGPRTPMAEAFIDKLRDLWNRNEQDGLGEYERRQITSEIADVSKAIQHAGRAGMLRREVRG